ncbi:calmodulin-binding transcription activator 4-like isoform X1 [Actinidia eriantha]|uniref:calmodulin-binding transcription activator 4-like isoform X1 n=1 Tax=Actinidia eriantha TaxID=165200 RepID=UPI00258F1EF6|nr:calmodulin-binding transcription activator 4-like isoform X1 [Actinidia eriantha]XP_057485498.1 calmodulin-binding transcription activator 4-like isoform X1 [Actinidia eriantha]
MTQSGYNLLDLVREAQFRWLKPAEVLFILQTYKEDQLTHEPPKKPSNGSLFLFNKRVLRFFRKDGHSWRKKKDGRTVGEAHERLKVGNVEALNCYYAHGEQNPDFQRRSYWMLDPECEHIVLVHYREISEGKHSSGSISQLSPGSLLTFSQSPSSHTAQHPGSATAISELYDPYQSPGSVEISSDAVANSNGMDHLDMIERKGESNGSSELEFSQALRRLEEQLSLNDETLEEIGSFCNGNENLNDSESIINGQSEFAPSVDDLNTLLLQQQSGGNRKHNHQGMAQQFIGEHKNSLPWKEKMGLSTSSPGAESEENNLCTSSENGILLSYSRCDLLEEQETGHWINFGTHDSRKCNDFPTSDSDANLQFSASSEYPQSSENPFTLPTSMFLSQEVDLKFPAYSPVTNTHHTDSDYFTTLFDKGQIGVHLEADSSLTIAQQQKFTIREISPDWGYASEATKVVIVGSFLCDPSEGAWTCMFGDREVPVQIIQEGVICCLAPPHLPGKVTLCITSGNQESCSEVREFDYRAQTSSCAQCSSPQKEITKSPEELLAFVRFAQMLLSDPSVEKGDMTESGLDQWGKFKAGEDSWNHVFEALLVGSWTSSSTTDWLLQELLKDKLQQWLSSRSKGGCDEQGCSLSKKEQGVIHMIAGMGFEWALNPILSSGVSINFRDINGWTALHWAAHFGREKMVAALIASGASAGAVTDPNSLDRTGKTPASVAASSGHKGLAGYLSEVALTSHLTSLTLQEKELSKGSPDVEAEIDVINFVQRNIDTNEDQHSLKDTLAAVRNAAQAAARIQAAFRAHSFRRRQQKEDASDAASSVDEYNILSNDIHRLSVASKLAFRNPRDYNTAALSIQKKFRGWKGRKDFLAFRQKVVKIQAHVRGHRVRKQYKVICWAVGVLEKVVLRWRRKGAGLRGFRQEMESIDESEDEDIIKVFRKQKVEGAIDEAFSRVLSMVDSPDARQQYSRVLGRYRQAKAELEGADSDVTSTSQSELFYMENVDAYQHP